MLPIYLAVEDVPVEESGPNPVIPNGGELIIGLLTFAIVMTFFEVIVALLQAYVFALLTAVYLEGALAEEH